MDPLERLVRAARDGDEQALEALVRATYPRVRQFCAALLDEAGADDLAQETYLRALPNLSGFRGDSSLLTWLLATARHVCLDELRRRERERRRQAAAARRPEPGPDASHSSVVGDLLGRLDPDRRAALVLTQLLGLSYAEAARVCDCPPGTIRSRVARARADLLVLLDPATGSPRAGGTPGAAEADRPA